MSQFYLNQMKTNSHMMRKYPVIVISFLFFVFSCENNEIQKVHKDAIKVNPDDAGIDIKIDVVCAESVGDFIGGQERTSQKLISKFGNDFEVVEMENTYIIFFDKTKGVYFFEVDLNRVVNSLQNEPIPVESVYYVPPKTDLRSREKIWSKEDPPSPNSSE